MENVGRPRLGTPRDTLPKTWRVSEMSERHHEVARMLLLGASEKTVAEQMGKSLAFVRLVRNSPVVREQLELLRAERDRESIDIAVQIQETLPECIELLKNQIRDVDGKVSPSLKSKNAFGLLSAGGHGPSKKLDVRTAFAVLSPEDIKEIRERGKSLKDELGDLIDVTPKEANG